MIVPCPCGTQNRVPAKRITSRARCGSCKGDLCPPKVPLAIQSESDFDELIRDATIPVIVDFWATWCGPCRVVAPELEKLSAARSGELLVAKVDTDAFPGLAGRFRIQGIPTMVLFRVGREVKRASGAMSVQGIVSALGL